MGRPVIEPGLVDPADIDARLPHGLRRLHGPDLVPEQPRTRHGHDSAYSPLSGNPQHVREDGPCLQLVADPVSKKTNSHWTNVLSSARDARARWSYVAGKSASMDECSCLFQPLRSTEKPPSKVVPPGHAMTVARRTAEHRARLAADGVGCLLPLAFGRD